MTIKSSSWPAANGSTVEASHATAPPTANQKGATDQSAVLGIKKKPRRRRVNANMAAASGANIGNANKTASVVHATASGNRTSNGNRGGAIQSKNASSVWDTDFDGAWEMGPDLIREFVMKQNNRNRSISESDVCKFVELQNVHDANVTAEAMKRKNAAADGGGLAADKRMADAMSSDGDDNLMQVAAAATSSIFNENICADRNIGNSDTSILMVGNLIRSEGYATPDTLSSLASDMPAPRRLYEREVSNESLAHVGIATVTGVINDRDQVDSRCDESSHLAAFEAKFNRNVEALWDDSRDDEQLLCQQQQQQQLVQPQSACIGQPMGGNVETFWLNYYKHHYNSDDQTQLRFPPMCDSEQKRFNDVNAMNSMPNFSANGVSVGERHPNLNQLYETASAQPTGGHMNLTSSIWADTVANNESDLSFYANAAALWDKGGNKGTTEQSYKVCRLIVLECWCNILHLI